MMNTNAKTNEKTNEKTANRHVPKPHEREYLKREEILHALTHAVGAVLAAVGLVLLLLRAVPLGAAATVGAAAFGGAMILLYSASALYHAACARVGDYAVCPVRDFFMKCDHCMIYVLIAGTYAPACLYAMQGWVGATVFAVVASCSVLGLILNMIDVDRFAKLSLVLYLITGWTIAAASIPYYRAIGPWGFGFLLLGGAFYTVGVIFYKRQTVPYMHVLWHLFVLGGSIAHFFMVYGFCLG